MGDCLATLLFSLINKESFIKSQEDCVILYSFVQQQLMRIVPRPPQSQLPPAGSRQLLPQPSQPQSMGQPRENIQLTNAQLMSIQTLFDGANRLTRPDKALILSFVGGERG